MALLTANILLQLARSTGQERLLESARDGMCHKKVGNFFRTQTTPTTCGFQTIAIMRESLDIRSETDGEMEMEIGSENKEEGSDVLLLAAAADAGIVDKSSVLKSGLTLHEFSRVLKFLLPPSFSLSITHASNKDSDKSKILTALSSPSSRIAVNYDMTIAGQTPPFGKPELGGHLSPLVAYHNVSDSVLVLDVWYDTEPVWIPWERLWRGMNAADKASGCERGFVVIC